jgi:GntR family transcriptional repressor for pyruvate dehydrogenase complex
MASVRGGSERRPLYEDVVERLGELIRVEELKPGDKLITERELATRLDVSRGSVRQALTALRVMGLIEIRHGDGIYLLRNAEEVVGTLAQGLIESHAHLPAINEAREALEPQAARLAALRRLPRDVAELRAALDEMRSQIERGETAVPADERFHRGIVVAARNEVLSALYDQLASALNQSSQASLARRGQPARSLREHEAIAEAIEAGDDQRAELSMRLHVWAVSSLDLAPPQRP